MYERESATLISPAPAVPVDIRYIELKTDMTVLTSDPLAAVKGDAYLLDKNGVRYDSSLVKVCNPAGVRRVSLGSDSIGNDAAGSPRRGAFGQARLNPRRNVLEIVSIQQLAEVVYGTIVNAFVATDSTVLLRDVKTSGQVYDQIPPLSSGGYLSVTNVNKLVGIQDGAAMAVLDIGTNSYRLVCCPAPNTTPNDLTVVTDVSFDIATGAWRKKTRTIYALTNILGTESSWTPYVAGLQAGSSYQRDPVTVTVTPSSGLVYGKPCRITMAVAPVSGTGTAAVTGYREIMIDDTYVDASQLITDPNSWQTGYYMTAGTHSLVGVYGGDANYNGNTSSQQSVSVAKATPSLSETHSPTGDTFEYGAQVTWSVVLNPGDIDLTQGSRNGNIGVNSIPSGNVTMTCDGVSFGHAVKSITFNGHAEFKFDIDHPLGAGSRTIVFTYEGDTNYNSCSLSKTLSITKKTLTYTTPNKSKIYGTPNPDLAGTWSGWVVGSLDTPASLGGNGIPTTTTTATTTSPASADSSQYPITTVAGPCSSYNYDLHFVNSILTITKANLVVTANALSMDYGDPMPSYPGSISGIQSGDNSKIHLDLTCDYTPTSEAKWYTIHANVTGDENVLDSYTIERHDSTFLVRKANLTVTANDQTMTQGGSVPAISASDGTVSGTRNSDDIQFAGSCDTDGKEAGLFVINASISSKAYWELRYSILYVSGILTVNAAP